MWAKLAIVGGDKFAEFTINMWAKQAIVGADKFNSKHVG